MRRSLVLLVLLLAALPGLARAQSKGRAPALDLPVVQQDLDNGLRVLVLEDHSIPNAVLYVGWRVGSRNERPGITGLAHYFEHMMFSGGERFGAGRFDPVMEAAGGSNNAYTSNDVTVYTDWFPAGRLPLILDMEADRMRAMRFDPALVETERGVVASERRLTVEDPAEVLREELWAAAFTAHPYQWPVLGWMDDIEGWEQADLETFFKTHYAPNNCVLVLVGDVEAKDALAQIEARLGALPRGPARAEIHTREPPQRGERRVVVEDPDASVPQLMVAWHIPETGHDDFPVLVVLEELLLGGESSRLDRALIQESELCLELAGGWQGLQFDPSLFTVDMVLREDAAPAQAEAALLRALSALREGGPSAEELDKVKRGLLLSTLAELSTIDGKANLLMDTELFFGGWGNLSSRLSAVQAVSAEDVVRVMERYLHRRNRTVATLTLESSADAPPESHQGVAAGIEADDEPHEGSPGDPQELPEVSVPALAARPMQLPQPRERVLGNGLRVQLLPDPEVPLVTLRVRALGGASQDPLRAPGLSQIVAGSILRGAGDRDASAFQRAVEGLGGELSAVATPRHLELEGQFLAGDVNAALELLVDVIRRPRLDEAEVEHELGIQLAELTALRDEPKRVLKTYWRRFYFGEHPLGRPLVGDEQSLQRITLKDVKAAARARLHPSRVWLSVAGDFDPEQVEAKLEELLGDWEAPEVAPLVSVGPAPNYEAERVLLIDDPGALQTYFEFGGPLFRWNDSAYPARLLANTVLGGRFTGRLNTALRIETGLTYGAYSQVDDQRLGVLTANSYTAVATSREALELARQVYGRFAAEGITQDELDSARSYLQGQLAPELIETAALQAKLLLDLLQDGLPSERIASLFGDLDALSLEQVNAVITERFPRRLTWAVIGPARTLRPILESFGQITEVELKSPGFGYAPQRD